MEKIRRVRVHLTRLVGHFAFKNVALHRDVALP